MVEDELVRISEATVAPLLHRVVKAPPREPIIHKPERDPSRIRPDPERLLHAYEHRPRVLSLIAEEQHWSEPTTSRLAKEVLTKGIWEKGPPIGNFKTYNITPKGEQYCRQYGIKSGREKSGTPTDRRHLVMSNSIQAVVLKQGGLKVQTKGTAVQVSRTRQVQPDFLVIGPQGVTTAVNVAHKNSACYEATAALRLAAAQALGPDHVLVVSGTASHQHNIEKHVDRLLERLAAKRGRERFEPIRAKLTLAHIEQIVSGKFDLSFMKEASS